MNTFRQKKLVIQEFLPEIKKFLEYDYTITQQLLVLEHCIPGFSISRDTYRKHIKDLLSDDVYYNYKKRQLFLRHIVRIKKAISLFHDTKDQFEYINLKGEKKVDGEYYFYVSLKDYEDFYFKYEDVFDTHVNKK